MFLLRLNDAAQKPIDLSGPLDQKSLTERINVEGILVPNPAQVSLIAVGASSTGVQVTGDIQFDLIQTCGRCDLPKQRSVNLPVSFLVRRKPTIKSFHDSDGRYEDDIGIYHVDEDNVELTPILEELIVLSISLFWSPPLDKTEKCTLCLSTFKALIPDEAPKTQVLSELLKKAGLN